MDMAFDLQGQPNGGTPGGVRHPSWPELRARLFASMEASALLERENRVRSLLIHGSFDDNTAAFVASHGEPHPSVNPIDLGNRKSGGTKVSPVAGNTRTGGRG